MEYLSHCIYSNLQYISDPSPYHNYCSLFQIQKEWEFRSEIYIILLSPVFYFFFISKSQQQLKNKSFIRHEILGISRNDSFYLDCKSVLNPINTWSTFDSETSLTLLLFLWYLADDQWISSFIRAMQAMEQIKKHKASVANIL